MGHQNLDAFSLILQAGPLVKLVLITLLLMSITSWGVMVLKWITFKNALSQNKSFLKRFEQAKNISEIEKAGKRYIESPAARLFFESSNALDAGIESLSHSLEKSTNNEISRLERTIPYLATVGSTAPFIGLFGTVWGIMNSFRNIGSTGAANLAVVAPGIAEALIATAAGLAAAIPAVMAYNFFVQRLRTINLELENFSRDFIFLAKMSTRKG